MRKQNIIFLNSNCNHIFKSQCFSWHQLVAQLQDAGNNGTLAEFN